MPAPTTPTQVPDEVREHRVERLILSQSCQGDPEACGCGGACPMMNTAA
ncbi:MAG: hypothetical protein LBE25_07950 [Arthrobacter sp.]|jgi:hypothetical protein|nr:hypothetical protein [Arthrobacter sp.]